MKEQLVPMTGDFITLSQFLKKVDLVSSGGESKFFLHNHVVMVNDKPEDRRGRKLHKGDRIAIDGQVYVLD
jgi:ribosome-associated protein